MKRGVRKEEFGKCWSKPGVFNFLSSRANLHLSCNPAGRSHCTSQNHEHMRLAGDVGEVPLTYVKQWNGCRMSLILQPLHRFTYVTAHSPTLPPLYLRHSSFSNPSAALPTSQFVLQPFRCFIYVIDTSPTSQVILQPFRRFIYVKAHGTTLPLLHLHPRHFT